MRLQSLCEDASPYNIKATKDPVDLRDISKFNIEINNKSYLPKPNNIIIIARDGNEIIGFVVAKPFRNVAHEVRIAVHPKYDRADLIRQLTDQMRNSCKSIGIKYITARSDDSELYTELYGEPVGSTQYKKRGLVHKFKGPTGRTTKTMPDAIGRPIQRVPGSRDTSIYKS